MKFTVAILALTGTLAFGAFSASNTVAAAQAKSQWDGVYTEAQAKRGEDAYSASCGSCHGDDLVSHDAEAPSLTGARFTSQWTGKTLAQMATQWNTDPIEAAIRILKTPWARRTWLHSTRASR